MIPKKISFFWSGGPLSWARYLTIYSFCKFNHDWEVTLITYDDTSNIKPWETPEQQDFLYSPTAETQDYIDKLPSRVNIIKWDHWPDCDINPIYACDFCRWQVLSSSGGLFSDLDILYTAPLDIRLDVPRILCCANSFFKIGLLGAQEGGDPLFMTLFNLSTYKFTKPLKNEYQEFGTNLLDYLCDTLSIPFEANMGIGHSVLGYRHAQLFAHRLTKLLYTYKETYLLPPESVYPWLWNDLSSIFVMNYPQPEDSFGIHWYAGSVFGQKFNQTATPENIHLFDNSLATAIKKVI